MRADVNGILLIDKPLGLSSAQVVGRAKYLLGARKAGHTGSLDPLASGMLPLCFGEATKFGASLLDADKTYRVVARLGERTASADRESPVIESRELPALSTAGIAAALAGFPRQYDQVPPMHSALKQEGRPLYEYARAGVTRERAARRIVIHELVLRDWRAPELEFDVRCSKGAYIRVLAEDLAARLGTIAHLAALRRLAVAPFGPELPLWTLAQLEDMSLAARRALLLPVDAALCGTPRCDVAPGQVAALRQGQPVSGAAGAGGLVRIYAQDHGFLGLGELSGAGSLSRNSSTPKLVIALPKNTGDTSPRSIAAWSNAAPAPSSSSRPSMNSRYVPSSTSARMRSSCTPATETGARFAPCSVRSNTCNSFVSRSYTPRNVSPLPSGQLIGYAPMPSTFSSSSSSSSGSRLGRSILLTKVKSGMRRARQIANSLRVCGSTPLAASISITALSAASSVRYVSSPKS